MPFPHHLPVVAIALTAILATCPATAIAQDAIEVVESSPAPAARRFAIGLSGLVGTRDDAGGELAPTWTAGLDVGYAIMPWAAVAIRRIGYGQARSLGGDRHAISVSPAFELSTRVLEWLEPYAQIGAALQVRFGGQQGRDLGIAPFLDGGLRIHALEWLSFSIEGALHVPVTSSFLLGHEIVPQGAFALQGGLGALAHF
jgi:hypothetical protein